MGTRFGLIGWSFSFITNQIKTNIQTIDSNYFKIFSSFIIASKSLSFFSWRKKKGKKENQKFFTCFWCLYRFCHHCEPQPLYNSTSPDPVRPLWHLMDVQWWPMWSNDRKNWWRSRQIAQTTMTRRRPKKLWHYLKLKWVVVHQLIRDIIDAQPSFFMDGPSSIRVSNYQILGNFVGCPSPKWFWKIFITDLISIIIIVKYFRVSFFIHFDFSNF